MIRRLSPALALCLAASAPHLAAQSLREGLALLPATADDVVICRDPKAFEAALRAFPGPSAGARILPEVGFGVEELAPGPCLKAEFPAPPKGAPQPGRALLAALPVRDAAALMARLKATRQGGLWAYALPGKPSVGRFAVQRGGFLLVSDDRALLAKAPAAKATLASEVDPACEAWLGAHGLSVLASARATREALADLVKGVDSPKAGALGSFQPRLKALALDAQASVTHLAVAADLAADGTAQGAFRAFYAPGSPLSAAAASLPDAGAHPLAGLPAGPFALALGGRWPQVLNALSGSPELLLAPYQGHPLPADLKADYLAARQAQAGRIQSVALRMGPTPEPGGPVLSGALMLLKVDDAGAFLAGEAKVAGLQAKLAKAAGMEPFSTCDPAILPDTPSLGLGSDLARTRPSQALPPQATLVYGLLFGGTVMHLSYAQVDPHTLVMVFGGADALRTALGQVRQGGAFPEQPLVRKVDGLLPAGSRFSLYLDPKGLRDLAQGFAAALGKGQEALPEVPQVPPFALAVTCDAGGLEIRGAAPAQSIQAVRDFFTEVQPKAPAPAAGE